MEHKPRPAPILEALKRLRIEAGQAVAVGDDSKDIEAAKRAGVRGVAVTWGAANKHTLLVSEPDDVCETVQELHQLLKDFIEI